MFRLEWHVFRVADELDHCPGAPHRGKAKCLGGKAKCVGEKVKCVDAFAKFLDRKAKCCGGFARECPDFSVIAGSPKMENLRHWIRN